MARTKVFPVKITSVVLMGEVGSRSALGDGFSL
jgi:hypothetical protein